GPGGSFSTAVALTVRRSMARLADLRERDGTHPEHRIGGPARMVMPAIRPQRRRLGPFQHAISDQLVERTPKRTPARARPAPTGRREQQVELQPAAMRT